MSTLLGMHCNYSTATDHPVNCSYVCVTWQVESWIMEHGTEWVGESWDELKYIRQVCCSCAR